MLGGASQSSQTPAFRPPRTWIRDLENKAVAADCQIYEKTNLFERQRDYPGQQDVAPPSVPAALRYLPSQGDSVGKSISLKKSCANTVQTAQTVQVVQDNDVEADGMWTVRTEDENTVQIPSGPKPLHNNILDSKDGLDGISATSYDGDLSAGQD